MFKIKKWSHQSLFFCILQVVRYVRAIRKGLIKFDKPKEESRFYMLWSDDSRSTEKARNGLAYIPPPRPKLPGIVRC